MIVGIRCRADKGTPRRRRQGRSPPDLGKHHNLSDGGRTVNVAHASVGYVLQEVKLLVDGLSTKSNWSAGAIAGPFGNLLWASPALPGGVHDIQAARTHGVIDALTQASCPPGHRPSTVPTPRSAHSVNKPWSSMPGDSCASCDAAPHASQTWSGPVLTLHLTLSI